MLLEEDIENFLEDERRAAEGDVETSIEEELKPILGKTQRRRAKLFQFIFKCCWFFSCHCW
jgi:hypothetical protein